jgi:hypothetical protein
MLGLRVRPFFRPPVTVMTIVGMIARHGRRPDTLMQDRKADRSMKPLATSAGTIQSLSDQIGMLRIHDAAGIAPHAMVQVGRGRLIGHCLGIAFLRAHDWPE